MYQPEIWHAIYPDMVLQHVVRFFVNLKKYGFWKKLYKIFCFSFFMESKKLFRKIRDSEMKDPLILRFLVPFVCILLKISIFGDFDDMAIWRNLLFYMQILAPYLISVSRYSH